MPSEFTLKNAQEQEFTLEHPDNAGAVRIKSNEIATKLELAAKVALADFTETNVSLTSSGYQKLPSGLVIQWGKTTDAQYGSVTFPISFPNSCFNVLISPKESQNAVSYSLTITTSTFTWGSNAYTTSGWPAKAWFAIGY